MRFCVLWNGKGKAWFGMLRDGYFHAWIRRPSLDKNPQ
jgi:hypothetical protein